MQPQLLVCDDGGREEKHKTLDLFSTGFKYSIQLLCKAFSPKESLKHDEEFYL